MVVACFVTCYLAVAVDMNRYHSAGGIPSSHLCRSKLSQLSATSAGLFGFRFRFELQKKELCRRRLKFIVSAELSKSFSPSFGLDSQSFQPQDPSKLPWVGPVPGDIAEIEAYCRIFRCAEWLHTALMDTLCNPLTGECFVSYDFTPDEKPLLEDKIVSVLGCMASLLKEAREDVLSGRSSIMNSFRVADVSAMEDKLPPLNVFRSEMKRCCESLHVALENYLMPNDGRSLDVWRKLQKLKNVCYDSGFPRREDFPSQMLFANWNPVYISTSKEDIGPNDSEVAFWRGGQVTEEGLEWLLKKGYKTIVDLRAETVKDNFYQAAMVDAIASGKIELVEIPVEVGTAPLVEQVEKFALLVSDSSKRPIYLHSKEGVWRTSAMVSRWRQHMVSRRSLQSVPNHSTSPKDVLLKDTNGTIEGPESSIPVSQSLPEKEIKSLQETADTLNGLNGVNHKPIFLDKDNMNGSSNVVHNELISIQGMTLKTHNDEEESSANTYMEIDPLKAQLPPDNAFSRKEMTKFFKTQKISPPTYFNYQSRMLEKLSFSRDMSIGTIQRGETLGTSQMPGHEKTRHSDIPGNEQNLSPKLQNPDSGKGKYLSGDYYVSYTPIVNGFGKSNGSSTVETYVTATMSNSHREQAVSELVKENQENNGGMTQVTSDDELGPVEGNMCASTTGVVRVQSRKKAEMFLVRTDGFSCTREKVTESSLAFTHPSTQQQMLMWKTTPKNVLLLKKLGQELMEEAKEVASFLYYQEKMNVLVEPDVHDIFARIPGFGFVQTFYSQDTSDLHERVDFVACLGGDGVILHASNLFRDAIPPVVSFNLGSLGFLTSHSFEGYRQDLRQVIHGNNTRDGVYITLRMRLRCEIYRKGKAVPGKVFDVLNEVVVDRGSNPYLSKIECYEHDRLITKVQGDGVIVATPTGSTAYSTAAGGSMVHPNVPCMLFTPICPHSLSFRPVILPDSARLELKIPEDARSNAWVSFDGKRRQQLSRGDSVRIYMSQHPLPTVNKYDQTGDWFHSLIRCLNWNERLDQKAL
ncbi:hypothetical protein UlMin_035890 [Ulmus minor]